MTAPGLAAGVHIVEDMVVFESVDEASRPVVPGTPGQGAGHDAV
jgi:hypothetical protein